MTHAIFTLLEELDAMLWETRTVQKPNKPDQVTALWISGVIQAVLILKQAQWN